jgi:hypothetical protein
MCITKAVMKIIPKMSTQQSRENAFREDKTRPVQKWEEIYRGPHRGIGGARKRDIVRSGGIVM